MSKAASADHAIEEASVGQLGDELRRALTQPGGGEAPEGKLGGGSNLGRQPSGGGSGKAHGASN